MTVESNLTNNTPPTPPPPPPPPPTRIRLTQQNHLKRNRTESEEESIINNPPSGSSKKLTLRFRAPQPSATTTTTTTTTTQDSHQDINNHSPSFHPIAISLWQTIVNATDPNGRLRSIDFMDLPSAIDYPDYYQVIKRPLALNDIKTKLDQQLYPSLDKLVSDIRLVFNNAKKYNLEYSTIYDDAHNLLKLIKRELANLNSAPTQAQDSVTQSDLEQPKQKKIKLKLRAPKASTPPPEPPLKPVTEPVAKDEPEPTRVRTPTPIKLTQPIPPPTSAPMPQPPEKRIAPQPPRSPPKPAPVSEAQKPKPKTEPGVRSPKPITTPTTSKRDLTLKAWIKTRLRALEEVREPGTGRQLIEEFQTLPDKSVWKQYYAVIPNPIAFENIRGKNDKRAYKDIESFKTDVHNIFKNAQHFNEDGSIVWKDSKILEEKFVELVKDAPTEFPEPVLRGPYKKTQERKLEGSSRATTPGQQQPQSQLQPIQSQPQPQPPLQQQQQQQLVPPPVPIGRTSPRLNPVDSPAAPKPITLAQPLPPPISRSPAALPHSRPASPLPERVLRSASRSPSRDRTATTHIPAPAPPPRVSSPLRPIIPTQNSIPFSVVAPTPIIPPQLTPSTMMMMNSFAATNGTPVAPPTAPTPNITDRVIIKLPTAQNLSFINNFNLITIPPTTNPLKIQNNFSRQHALKLPINTKAIRLVCENIRLGMEVKCRSKSRVVRDGNEAFVIEILEGGNVVEVIAGEKEMYRIFIYK
ncbi:hypothetical protein CROQUDRAFT_58318 [Cronartium quercuum f. sp. fusiforme G11]|uniref:Bromo domain-containing protein n=1 Tax=Cronartium quercuum f. sp. fusiforme G11 TaxID=708437 RepID=A0A9P6NUB9_9BASI|nr:hypothetical protein CROQUDRAFT_58318 [Cronartium quercuum f. sp. fusiforme G11]